MTNKLLALLLCAIFALPLAAQNSKKVKRADSFFIARSSLLNDYFLLANDIDTLGQIDCTFGNQLTTEIINSHTLKTGLLNSCQTFFDTSNIAEVNGYSSHISDERCCTIVKDNSYLISAKGDFGNLRCIQHVACHDIQSKTEETT